MAGLGRKEGIAQSLYYTWSKEFMEAGKRRLAGDTARAATTGEVQDLRREARALKECVAALTLENRLLKKSMIADGGDDEGGIPQQKNARSCGSSSIMTSPTNARWARPASTAAIARASSRESVGRPWRVRVWTDQEK